MAHDFAGERIIVADSGGGSTELATGVYAPERGVFALEGTRSLDIGCRRVTERFFSALPPADGELLPLPRGQVSSSPPILRPAQRF